MSGKIRYAGRYFSDHNLEGADKVGLTRSRWLRYQEDLRKLKLRGGIFKTNNSVLFVVDPPSIFNGDSYKGYLWTPLPRPRLYSNLDSYRVYDPKSDLDKDRYGNWAVYKRLKGNWYLYLFVNH